MKIFVVNCGSSSLKYQLFEIADERVLARGMVERVGSKDAQLTHQSNGGPKVVRRIECPDHKAGLHSVLAVLTEKGVGVLDSVAEIGAIGHRVLHGGEQIVAPTLVDERVIGVIRENFVLGPLHNPPNLAGIEAAMEAMPGTPNVAVFDTAFFATMPPKAHRYAVPTAWYRKYHVRKYGFHGTSHRYVAAQAAHLLGKPADQVNLITCHLGNGCSMTAIAGGKAVDHSMGLTPLEGLVMGTRSGDIDPAVVLFMVTRGGLSPEDVDRILNKESGLLGVSGTSNDMRDLLAAAGGGNADAALAVEMFVYRIAKYVGSYLAVLPPLDALVLTGGIGENAGEIRERVCHTLAGLGATLDKGRNDACRGGKSGPITVDGARLPVWVVPTNEELMIARDTAEIVAGVLPRTPGGGRSTR